MPIREGMVMAKVEDKIEADIAIKLSDAVTELPVAKKMKVIDLSEVPSCKCRIISRSSLVRSLRYSFPYLLIIALQKCCKLLSVVDSDILVKSSN